MRWKRRPKVRESLLNRLRRLEENNKPLPRAVVAFSDGHTETLRLNQIATAFLEQNKVGVIAVEWERPSCDNDAVIFQLLADPEIWKDLMKERITEYE